MNCQQTRAVFAELLDHRTAPTARLEARTHLANCPECQHEFAALAQTATALDTMPTPSPSPRLRNNFYAMLAAEKATTPVAHPETETVAATHGTRRPTWWRWVVTPLASAALMVLGFMAGARQASTSGPPVPGDDSTQRELAALRKQMATMTQLVGYTLLQQQEGPANERLRAVLASANTAAPSDKVLDNLISALAFDPSANVRLRALEALYPHADNLNVRAGVTAALPREQNPLVQLELIDFVAAAKDREATPTLVKMSQNESLDRAVREAAVRALAQL